MELSPVYVHYCKGLRLPCGDGPLALFDECFSETESGLFERV